MRKRIVVEWDGDNEQEPRLFAALGEFEEFGFEWKLEVVARSEKELKELQGEKTGESGG